MRALSDRRYSVDARGMENDEFSVTPLNTNKYLLAFVRVVWCKKTVVRHTFCRHKHSLTHTHTSQSTLCEYTHKHHRNGMEIKEESKRHASGEWATNECFQFEPCYSYRLRIVHRTNEWRTVLDANSEFICKALHENAKILKMGSSSSHPKMKETK